MQADISGRLWVFLDPDQFECPDTLLLIYMSHLMALGAAPLSLHFIASILYSYPLNFNKQIIAYKLQLIFFFNI